MKQIYSIVLVALLLMATSFSIAQDFTTSVGPAPVESIKLPGVTPDNPLNANNRGFVYISGTSSHQLNKQFMGNVTVTAIGSPFTTAGWVGALARNTSTGVIYTMNQASPFQIWSVDTTTGVCTQVVASCTGVPEANFTGMVWDHTTNTMWGLSSSLTTSSVFTINMTTGVCTQVGSASTVAPGGITLMCAPNGSLFVVDIVNDNLCRVNKSTGAFSIVGALGFAANYGQDGAFDLSDGMCYLASAGPGNILRVCDTTTGSATTTIGTYAGQPSCLTIVASAGPAITHTPLPNTQNVAGPYVVNAVITPTGSGTISSGKIYWSRNNVTLTDSITMTNSGSNYTGSIPGNSTNATYRYLIRAIQSNGQYSATPVYTFVASSTDTSKPVIVHTPLGNVPKATWPATVTASVTDNLGLDSVWVRWYKNNTGTGVKHFKLLLTTGTNYAAAFNSIQADVNYNDSIFYRVFARDNSTSHNTDSTALNKFKIVNLVNACIGTGTVSSNYPFTTYWMDGRTQMLFTSTELLTAGVGNGSAITRLGFNVITVGGPAMSGFTVRFQHTTQTSLTGFVSSGWTTGFTGTYTVAGTGWQYIDMTSPYFTYNGTSNLLIEVCYDNSAYTAYSPVNSTAAPNMTWGYYTDNVTGCTMTGGAVQASRPNTCIVAVMGAGNNNTNLVPNKYELSQNYPNPFNPTTKINFAIPKQGLVTMKIYDILGREVRTLVNEVKQAGNYTVDFNASEFSSGVYFYKLTSGDFSDIKRMILVK